MLAIEAKDRTPVGSDVADCGELVGQLVRTLQTGHDHDVVHFAYGTVFLVDGADFRLDEELRLADASGREKPGISVSSGVFRGRGRGRCCRHRRGHAAARPAMPDG